MQYYLRANEKWILLFHLPLFPKIEFVDKVLQIIFGAKMQTEVNSFHNGMTG